MEVLYMNNIPISAPIFYNSVNTLNSATSNTGVKTNNAPLTHMYRKYLLQKAMSVFKWKLPEHWSKEYLLYALYTWGYAAIINTNKFGVIPQLCTLQGWDVFYRPNRAVISNQHFKGIQTPIINVECTILKLQPDYGSINDLVSYYAEMMALVSESVGVNIVNSKLSYVFKANNKGEAETLKALYNDIMSGKPAVVYEAGKTKINGGGWELFQQNLAQNYITDKLLSDLRKIENMFNTEIGIPNANTDKKERLITDEVNANNAETATKCDLWLELLKEGCKKTRNMFGIDIDVDWRYSPAIDEEKIQNESGDRNVE